MPSNRLDWFLATLLLLMMLFTVGVVSYSSGRDSVPPPKKPCKGYHVLHCEDCGEPILVPVRKEPGW